MTLLFTKLDLKDAVCIYCSNFFKNDAVDYYNKLNTEIDWEIFKVLIYGKLINQPRETCYIANDERLSYTYSGVKRIPKPWTTTLMEIKSQLNLAAVREFKIHTNSKFNAVLCNRYKDGNDYISFHSDDESDLVRDSFIASVSFGAPREFIFRSKFTDEPDKHILLEPGSVLFMGKNSQKKYKHSIPKDKSIKKSRINLTFRVVKPY